MENLCVRVLVILAVLGGMNLLTACEPAEGPVEDMGEEQAQIGE